MDLYAMDIIQNIIFSYLESVHGSFGLVATWENQNKCKVINWAEFNLQMQQNSD